MAYRFLPKDDDALLARIEDLRHGVWDAGQEEGFGPTRAPRPGTTNFGYEQEERRQWAWSHASNIRST